MLARDGPKRFNEIKRMVGGISQRNADPHAARIGPGRPAEADTIPDDSAALDYQSTQLGRALWEAVKPLGDWARGHIKHITRARAAFDKKVNA